MLKSWIPYGRGSKNHAFVRMLFFTVSAPIWEPFSSPKRTKDSVLVHFGGPGYQIEHQCGEYFSTVFFEGVSGLHFREKGSKREGARERGQCRNIVPPPPSHTLPPAPQRPEKQSFPEYIGVNFG